jgi:hypothetical protein
VIGTLAFVAAIVTALAVPLLRAKRVEGVTQARRAGALIGSGTVALGLILVPPMTGAGGEPLRLLRQYSVTVAGLHRPTPSISIYIGAVCSLAILLAGACVALAAKRASRASGT